MNQHDSVPLDQLSLLPVFAGMTDRERQQLVDIASTMTFPPGEVVMRQGKTSRNLLVLLEGRCQVMVLGGSTPTSEIVLAELQPYEHFGEMSFFEGAPHSASVRTTTAVKLLRIERTDYDLLIKEGNLAAYKLAFNMVGKLAERLRRMDQWVTDLVEKQPEKAHISEWSHFRDKLFSNWNL
jgi:CRP-like cAMP-binding protein